MPSQRRALRATARGILLIAEAIVVAPCGAQEIDDAARLAGVASVALRASASWDDLITTDAGGATSAQFHEALTLGLEEAIRGGWTGPRLDADADGYVLCHVDTAYETGLVLYAVRVSYHEPGEDGPPVIVWLRSWVGSYTTQQLHLLWGLADQCAHAFLEAWAEGNG